MNKETSDILDTWAKVLNFDPKQTHFDLGNFSFDIYAAGNAMLRIIDEYDDSGNIALLYAKKFFLKYLKSVRVTLYDVLEDDGYMHDIENLYDAFDSSYVKAIESSFLKSFADIVDQLDMKFLHENNSDLSSIFDKLSDIVDCIDNFNIEFWRFGDPMNSYQGEFAFVVNVLVFDTIAEAMIHAESSRDGIFLAYITDNNGPGGYFSFIFKLFGNIISINDRVKESFRGQHRNSRNNRWIERKNYGIFPYQLIEYVEKYDYLGYSTGMHIKEDAKRTFASLGEDAFKIILTMILIFKRFTSSKFHADDYALTYSDRLLDANIGLIEQKNWLVEYSDSEILNRHHSTSYFSDQDIKDVDRVKDFLEGTDFCNDYGKEFIAMYAKDFHVNCGTLGRSVLPKLQDNSSSFDSEYVADELEMNLQLYEDGRKQLADYIVKKIADAYVIFGGKPAIEEWFRKAVQDNVNEIKNICIEKHLSSSDKHPYDRYGRTISEEFTYCIREDENEYYPYFDEVLNDRNENDTYTCPVTGTTANTWFSFRPRTESEICKIIGSDVIDILKGYKEDHDCKINNLLNRSDPMAFVGTPIEVSMSKRDEMKEAQKQLGLYGSSHCELSFSIGFSKRGLNKLIKNSNIVIVYENGHLVSKEE